MPVPPTVFNVWAFLFTASYTGKLLLHSIAKFNIAVVSLLSSVVTLSTLTVDAVHPSLSGSKALLNVKASLIVRLKPLPWRWPSYPSYFLWGNERGFRFFFWNRKIVPAIERKKSLTVLKIFLHSFSWYICMELNLHEGVSMWNEIKLNQSQCNLKLFNIYLQLRFLMKNCSVW